MRVGTDSKRAVSCGYPTGKTRPVSDSGKLHGKGRLTPQSGGRGLVMTPIGTTHHGVTPEERPRREIVGGMVELSAGLEDAGGNWFLN
ncbi:hypothetical protein OKW42_004494 [Paraburkholderia sp. WC7.3d]